MVFELDSVTLWEYWPYIYVSIYMGSVVLAVSLIGVVEVVQSLKTRNSFSKTILRLWNIQTLYTLGLISRIFQDVGFRFGTRSSVISSYENKMRQQAVALAERKEESFEKKETFWIL